MLMSLSTRFEVLWKWVIIFGFIMIVIANYQVFGAGWQIPFSVNICR